MSDDEIPGQQSFEIDDPTPAAPPRSHRRAVIAASTAAVTGLVVVGWGVSDTVAHGRSTAGFPHVATLTADSTINPALAARNVTDAVVDIVSTDGDSGEEDAGTGMVITSSGDILTNNHVVDGATSIRVTLVKSGATYQARVLGTDAS